MEAHILVVRFMYVINSYNGLFFKVMWQAFFFETLGEDQVFQIVLICNATRQGLDSRTANINGAHIAQFAHFWHFS